ncbi:hypothetical protein [Erwinia sp. 198]|uniref:hypothetical protein n=1 Tax=Erwinia sp. 198 TaxID=2022746 RepID=UPI000F68D3A7|nr:hypothetical protein [Erwinia sp. 198]RRZ89846.1 hypothetical protein EGK14_15215 [Erwinia sp. 198]
MKNKMVKVAFCLLYLFAGYHSWSKVMQYYLSDRQGIVGDMHSYFIAPLIAAFFWLLIYLFSTYFFRRFSLASFAKYLFFNIIFLAANYLILTGVAKISSYYYNTALNQVQLVHVNNQFLFLVYIIPAILTLLIFAGVRKKWQ